MGCAEAHFSTDRKNYRRAFDLSGFPLSVPAIVGFIAVFGATVINKAAVYLI
jgi:hypothetical protein